MKIGVTRLCKLPGVPAGVDQNVAGSVLNLQSLSTMHCTLHEKRESGRGPKKLGVGR
jgi:hypothetical protein